MNKISLVFLLLLVAVPFVSAEIDFDRDLSQDEKKQFDSILAPVMKIYSFIKYAATVAGVLMLVFSGFSFVMAGGEQKKKETAKHMAAGVIIGLIVIWVAPLVVNYIFA